MILTGRAGLIALICVLSLLRFVVPADERGRVKAGIFFAGAYLVAVFALGVFRRATPPAGHHDVLRMLSDLFLIRWRH